jgi:hypothetical protein
LNMAQFIGASCRVHDGTTMLVVEKKSDRVHLPTRKPLHVEDGGT